MATRRRPSIEKLALEVDEAVDGYSWWSSPREPLVVYHRAVTDEVWRIVNEQEAHRGWKRSAAMAIRDALATETCGKMWAVDPEALTAEEFGDRQQW